jgi:hypothetical protein
MNASAFNYSIRLPLAARLVNPDWLGSKFLATGQRVSSMGAPGVRRSAALGHPPYEWRYTERACFEVSEMAI